MPLTMWCLDFTKLCQDETVVLFEVTVPDGKDVYDFTRLIWEEDQHYFHNIGPFKVSKVSKFKTA
jgi:hypothetical protein